MLASIQQMPAHQFWPVDLDLREAIAPFRQSLFGHRQITDAYLLGLAIAKEGQLVTLDRSIATLAGPEHADHLLVL